MLGEKISSSYNDPKKVSLVYLVKQQSQLSLRFSHPFTQTVSSFSHEERHFLFPLTALISQRSGYQSFSSSWRPVKETAPKNRQKHKLQQPEEF